MQNEVWHAVDTLVPLRDFALKDYAIEQRAEQLAIARDAAVVAPARTENASSLSGLSTLEG